MFHGIMEGPSHIIACEVFLEFLKTQNEAPTLGLISHLLDASPIMVFFVFRTPSSTEDIMPLINS